MPLDKHQKKPHSAQAGPQDGWSSRANRRWGSSGSDGELSPALLLSLCPGWHSLDMGRLGCVARLMVASLSGPQPAPFLAFTV